VLLQEEKLAHASFPPQWNDIVQYVLVFVQGGKLAHGGMMLFEKRLCLCNMEN
jgi:hypothetical protein